MKKFDENLNPSENSENENSVLEEMTDEAALNQELEEIKDMFQAELDKAMNEENNNEGEYREDEDDNTEIYSTDEINSDEDEIDPSVLCECCEKNLKDTSYGEDYPYCSECRELMRKYPFGFKGIATLVSVIVLILVSIFVMFPKSMDIIGNVMSADAYSEGGKLYSGLYTYYDALSAANSDFVPKKLVAKCAKAFASLSDYRDASSIAEKYLSETDLKLPMYGFIKEYASKSDTLIDVENALYDTIASKDATEDKIDEAFAIIDKLAQQEDKNYDPYYLDYYRYVAMHSLDVDLDKQYEKLLEIDETYGKDEWIHCYDLCNAAALMGNAEKAEEYLKRITDKNSEDGTAYAYYANAYRFAKETNPDKMFEIIDEGIKAQGSYSYASSDLYRVQAIAYLLKGDYDKALESSSTMYSVISASNFSVNNLFESLYTYALSALLADDTEAYSTVTELLKYNGYSLPESIINAAKSKDALIKLITDTEGDLT